MKKLLNAKNGDILYSPSSFIIRGIEFEMTCCPNGWKQKMEGKCSYFVEVKHLPSDIEFITIYCEICYETTNRSDKFMRKWSQTGAGQALFACLFSQCKNFKQIDFHCMVEILGIKYKRTQIN